MAEHSPFVREGKLDVDAAAAELERFLGLLLKSTRLALRYEFRKHAPGEVASGLLEGETPPALTVVFKGEDEDLLLAHHAELMHSIEYVAQRWLHLEPENAFLMRMDCADYRATRLEELRLTAKVAAQRVRETHQPFRFQPMNSRERRAVHLALAGEAEVRTESEGMGPRRQVVIYPAEKK
jgi:spoIIIJ-associated protein